MALLARYRAKGGEDAQMSVRDRIEAGGAYPRKLNGTQPSPPSR